MFVDKEYIPVLKFIVKFIFTFLLFYFGTLFVIGLSAPGGWYSKTVDHYLDYVSWLKFSYLRGASFVAGIFGYDTIYENGFLVRVVDGRGVIIAYDCVGYGVMSFWAAFILSNTCRFFKKLIWLTLGWSLLWLINVLRIGLFLVAINKSWKMPLGINHHTWFNIVAYFFIFLLIFLFEKSEKVTSAQQEKS